MPGTDINSIWSKNFRVRTASVRLPEKNKEKSL